MSTDYSIRISSAVCPEEYEELLEEVTCAFFKLEEDKGIAEKVKLLGLIRDLSGSLEAYYNPARDEYEGDNFNFEDCFGDDYGWDCK